MAIEDYSKAIELNPEDAVSYYYRGGVYLVNRKTRRALSDFNMAIKLNPKFDNAYVSKGNIYFSRRNFSKAIENNEKALDLNPDNAVAKRLQLFYAERQNATIRTSLPDYVTAAPGYLRELWFEYTTRAFEDPL